MQEGETKYDISIKPASAGYAYPNFPRPDLGFLEQSGIPASTGVMNQQNYFTDGVFSNKYLCNYNGKAHSDGNDAGKNFLQSKTLVLWIKINYYLFLLLAGGKKIISNKFIIGHEGDFCNR